MNLEIMVTGGRITTISSLEVLKLSHIHLSCLCHRYTVSVIYAVLGNVEKRKTLVTLCRLTAR